MTTDRTTTTTGGGVLVDTDRQDIDRLADRLAAADRTEAEALGAHPAQAADLAQHIDAYGRRTAMHLRRCWLTAHRIITGAAAPQEAADAYAHRLAAAADAVIEALTDHLAALPYTDHCAVVEAAADLLPAVIDRKVVQAILRRRTEAADRRPQDRIEAALRQVEAVIHRSGQPVDDWLTAAADDITYTDERRTCADIGTAHGLRTDEVIYHARRTLTAGGRR